jgi:hypothetical protein
MIDVSFFSLDELHLISNVSKLFFSLLSSQFNARYKHGENSTAFPFELTKADLEMIKQSIDASTKDVPTHFNSTWKGLNYNNARSLWRSIEWIEHFLFSVPCIVSPRFKEEETTIAVNKLVRACLLAMQWLITKEQLDEIKR